MTWEQPPDDGQVWLADYDITDITDIGDSSSGWPRYLVTKWWGTSRGDRLFGGTSVFVRLADPGQSHDETRDAAGYGPWTWLAPDTWQHDHPDRSTWRHPTRSCRSQDANLAVIESRRRAAPTPYSTEDPR
jgi:hypothetical protein